ncbi:MAG: hypothetical protein QME28_05440 [Candidatus Saccharicenans sp.]|nr:hypothetical protein [Candidatus Saccharicenans sp.]
MERKVLSAVMMIFLLLISAFLAAQDRPAVKPENLVGTWELVVDAGQMVINLNLAVALENGNLTAKISEPYGSFSDVPATEVKLENNRFSFNLTVPSPPDGATRTWTFDLEVSGEEMDGIVYNNEIQVSVPVRGKKSS